MSRYNNSLLQPIILLIALGLIMVYSASANPYSGNVSGLVTLGKQFKWLILGSIFLFICSFVNYRKLIDISKPILFISIFIAVLGYFTKPHEADTARWLTLFGKSLFQTSELVKIALIVFTASFIDKNKRKISDSKFMLKNYYPYLLVSLIVVFFQPDLSSSIMIGGISISMLFIAGIDKKQIQALFVILISAFILKFFFNSKYIWK
jgi:cell division protein FtsW (lipid II flippase)